MAAACGRGNQPINHANRAETPSNGSAAEEAPTVVPANGIEERLAREKWHGDLDGIAKRRILRVLVAPSKLGFYFNGLHLQGAMYELSREFEHFLNKKLNTGNLTINVLFIPVARERLIPMLEDGKGDLVASLMEVTETREKIVEFSDPLLDKAKNIIVSGPGAPRISSLEDLAGKEIYYFKNTVPYEKLRELSETFQREGKAPIELTPADEDLQPEDVLEMVNAGLVSMTVSEDKLLQFWAKVLPHLQPHPNMIVTEGPLSWAMQNNTPQLKSMVDQFVQGHQVGTAYGNIVQSKYLDDIKWAKPATIGGNLLLFEELVKLFEKYGDKYDLPYLLLEAQGFQESGLNQKLRSPAGAVGVMQIKPSTAAGNPIDIPDVMRTDRNIEAGAKYLHYMVNQYFANEPMDPVTKAIFALASYNAGPNEIEKLRTRAAAEGYDPNRWFNNVEIAVSEVIGQETCQYVSNIYKYYLAYKMVVAKDQKRQESRHRLISGARK
jgi:membrane-bound lytic murein transglycosylase MltF